jgi:tripartite-type tricarboxylate transporter receptor subunit TctC
MIKLVWALFLCVFLNQAWAKETVTVLFAFGAGDSVANYGRTLVNEANQIQTKYRFIFDVKPGAGGTIAAQHAKNSPNTILATSAAFFVRPNVYPKDSHDIDHFNGLMIQCTAPMAVASTKYRSWDQVPTDKEITFGITGLGATSHLVSLKVQEKFPKLILIPFKSPTDATLALVSGQIDLSVGFLSEFQQWADKGPDIKVNVLGITGQHSAQDVTPMFKQGFKDVIHMGNPQQLIVPKSVPKNQQQEWHQILTQAAAAASVQAAYKIDSCQPAKHSFEETQQLFTDQSQFWRKITAGIKVQ